MDQPPTSTTTADPAPQATSDGVNATLWEARVRTFALRDASNRAEANRYTERGGALEDASRAAGAARHEADAAKQQAQDVRYEATTLKAHIVELTELSQEPDNDVRFAQQQIERSQTMLEAVEQRAEGLERIVEDSGARADALARRVTELQHTGDDAPLVGQLREAADKMDKAVEQLELKARLLSEAESHDRTVAELEAQGDPTVAATYRDQAAGLRAQAEAIQPDIPEGAQDLIDAADRSAAPETEPGAGQQPADGQQPTPDVPQPSPAPSDQAPETPTSTDSPDAPAPAAQGQTGSVDADGDGLSDKFERELGTNVNEADTDGDGYPDGLEVHWSTNARVRSVTEVDLDRLADGNESAAEWEASEGLDHNADRDGDGVADWIERDGLDKVPDLQPDKITSNKSPLDQFVDSALEQRGKPYRFGAEVDPADSKGGGAFDSAELVEWAAKQAGVRDMPDGTWNQYRWLDDQDATMSAQDALNVKGALVFGFSSDPVKGIPDRRYVAISVGDGKNVIEVSERSGEVKVMPAGDLYKYGARIPALHEPDGDLDGDGSTDRDEMLVGGDPSRSVVVEPDVEIEDEDDTGSGDGSGSGTTDPANPADAVDPAGPNGSANPTGTVDPASPAGAADPVSPAKTANPLDPASPAAATDPVNPVNPSGSTGTPGATDPLNPASPVLQAVPLVDLVNPVDSVAQDTGTDPTAPTAAPDTGTGDGSGDPLGSDRYPSDSYDDSYDDADEWSDEPGAGAGDDGPGSYGPTTVDGNPYIESGSGSYGPSAGDAYSDTGADDSSYGASGGGDADDSSYYSDASTYE